MFGKTFVSTSGGGGGGIVLVTNPNDVMRCNACGTTGWDGTIASLPGATDTITYNPITANENTMVAANTSALSKLILYNKTRGNSALILQCNNATNTITFTSTRPSNWQVGNSITTKSQLLLTGSHVDYEIISGDFLGKTGMFFTFYYVDSAAAGMRLFVHPYETYSNSKQTQTFTQVAGLYNTGLLTCPLNSNRFSMWWDASGAATVNVIIREAGYIP